LSFINKQLIADSFGHAANTYDALSGLQKEVGLALLARLGPIHRKPLNIQVADVGCGTGWMTRQLRRRLPEAMITGIDLAAGMVAYAKAHCAELSTEWMQGDMESLPLADASQDLVYSNLAMQWLDDPIRWFTEVRRVLKPGGQLLCTTLLTGTLSELQASWEVADQSTQDTDPVAHVNRFFTLEYLNRCLQETLEGARCEEESRVRHYPSVRDVMGELKGVGAHNINQGRPKGFTGKSRIKRMMSHYETYRTAKGVPTTYIVGVMRYVKPVAGI